MTTAARPAAFTGSPEQILTDIITAHGQRLTDYIATHFARGDRFLADDLAQETFIHLWRYNVAPGVVIDDRAFGLLIAIARQMVSHHLRRRRSHEVVIDFTDPAVATARQAQAAPMDTPYLASLYADLEAAKTALTGAADRYRLAARAAATAQTALRNAVRPEAIEQCTLRVGARESAVKAALEEFRVAAERVAQARTEWNAAAADHAALVVTSVTDRGES